MGLPFLEEQEKKKKERSCLMSNNKAESRRSRVACICFEQCRAVPSEQRGGKEKGGEGGFCLFVFLKYEL